MKEFLEEAGISITVAGIVLALLVLVVTVLTFFSEGFVRPTVLDLRREANQKSQQYVETTQEKLFQLKRKYEDLEGDIVRLSSDESNTQTIVGMKARQESLLDEMEFESLSIPESEIPEPVKNLLKEKGKLQ